MNGWKAGKMNDRRYVRSYRVERVMRSPLAQTELYMLFFQDGLKLAFVEGAAHQQLIPYIYAFVSKV